MICTNKHVDISHSEHQESFRELEALIARDEFIAKSLLEEVDSRGSDRTIFDNYDVYTGIGINRNYDI